MGDVWKFQDSTSGYAATSTYNTYEFWSAFTADAAYSADRVGFYAFANPQNSPKFKIGVYADNAGVPGNLLAYTGEITVTASGWFDADLNTPVSISNGVQYWLGHITDIAPTTQWRYRQSSPPLGGSRYRTSASWPTLFSPAGTTTSSSYRYGAYRIGYDDSDVDIDIYHTKHTVLVIPGYHQVSIGAAWLSNWKYRRQLTIPSSKIQASMTHAPIIIALSESCGLTARDVSSIFTEIGANRKKIAVCKNDGTTQLYAHIHHFDNTAKQMWLAVSKSDLTLTNGQGYDLYLYYDAAQADNTTYIGDTNDTAAENVYDTYTKTMSPCKDDPDSAHLRDATANSNDLTKFEAGGPAETASGKIGVGQDHDGVDDYLHMPVNHTAGQSEIYISLWMNFTSFGAGNSIYDAYNGQYWQFTINKGKFYTRDASGGPTESRDNDVTWTNPGTGWHYVGIRYSVADGRKSIYVDDAENAFSTTNVGQLTTERDAERIGYPSDGSYLDDIVDELYICIGNARSLAWHKFLYWGGDDKLLIVGVEESYSGAVEVTISLARSAAVAHTGGAAAGASAALAKSVVVSGGGPAIAGAVLAIGRQTAVGAEYSALFYRILALGRQAGAAAAAGAGSGGSVGLGKNAALAQGGGASADGSVVYPGSFGISAGAQQLAQALVSLIVHGAVVTSGGAAAGASAALGNTRASAAGCASGALALTALARSVAVNAGAGVVQMGVATFAATYGMAPLSITQSLAQAALARLLGMGALTGNAVAVDMDLPRAAGVVSAAGADAAAGAQYQVVNALLTVGTAEAAGALVVPLLHAVALDARADGAGAVSIGRVNDIGAGGGITLGAALSFAAARGLTSVGAVLIEGIVTLDRSAAISSAAGAAAGTAAELSRALALVALAGAVTDAGLSLAALRSVDCIGDKIIATLITPEGRIITVDADNRIIVMEQDNRVIDIDTDNRIIS